MKEEAGILEVDYRSERPGVKVGVFLELEVCWEGRSANGEVAFEGLEGCVADGGRAEGACELPDGANDVYCCE
jgi:hypothetical protein